MNVAVKEFEVEKPISKATLKAREKYEGKVFPTNQYGSVEVILFSSSKSILVRFVNTGYEAIVPLSRLVQGAIKDPLQVTYYGVGCLGKAQYKGFDASKTFKLWKSVLARCYSRCTRYSENTYKDCTVSSNFLNYNYFKDWCENQVGFGNKGWHLDKDLLVKGNKIYSPETCCFIPAEINSLLTTTNKRRGDTPLGVSKRQKSGNYEVTLCRDNKDYHLGTYSCPVQAFNVYKEAKEDYFRSKAEKYKGKISDEAYEALKNRKVEITD